MHKNGDIYNPTIRRWIFLGIPILFGFAFIMSNLYKWSNNSLIVAVFAPVNESVWEHFKLTYFPMLVWWLLGYLILHRREKVSFDSWFLAAAVSLFIAPLFIMCFYYTYTGALGIHSLFLDILSMLIGIILGQLAAYRVYKRNRNSNLLAIFAIILITAGMIVFGIFTFRPPHLPLFKDSLTGLYGVAIQQ